MRALSKQYLGKGIGVAMARFENYRAFSLRHLALMALIFSLILPLALAVVWPPALIGAAGVLMLSVTALVAATLISAHTEPGAHELLLPAAFATLHLSYGRGSLYGLGVGVRRTVARMVRQSSGPMCVLLCIGLTLSWVACPARAVGATPAVWFAPSMERIARDSAQGSGLSIELYAARGEYQSFQIAIQAPKGGLTNVTVHVEDLLGEAGARIPAANVTLFREHYVQVVKSSPDLRGINRPLGAGWYPDALVPFGIEPAQTKRSDARIPAAPFAVAPGQNQPVWVDVFVPREAPARLYSATVAISSDQGGVSGTLLLHVWNFTLPRTPSLHSMFVLWDANTLEAEVELLKHRLMPRSVKPGDEAWLIKQWGLQSVNIGLWSDATLGHCSMAPAPSLKSVREASAVHQTLRRYNYTADEIDNCRNAYGTMKAWGRVLHEAGVDNLVTMSPVPELYDDGSGKGRSAVDIWVLLPTMYDAARERVEQVLRKGDEVWSYNALVQDDYSPKWAIDFAPINYRIQPGLMSQSLHLTGLLYWRVDLWTDDPWTNVQTYRTQGNVYPGEGMLVYPGKQAGMAGVVPSMRLKWLRDGVDDYEYVEILKRAGCNDLGMKVSRRVAASWSQWTKDPAVLESERHQLGTHIERVSQGAKCPE